MSRNISTSGKMKQSNDWKDDCAFQVIILGASGGPREDTVTGMLVRSTATKWAKNSIVAVDAGTLLSGIIRILEKSSSNQTDKDSPDMKTVMSSGAFSGLELPHVSAEANAAYIFREIVDGVLITHPHLDHVAGLAMNTPAVEAQSSPKSVSALPSSIAALKNHVFNDITWPNLSDENGGAGLITYQRLVDGGNQRLGRGSAKGYVKATDGLTTKCLSVSHGKCSQRYNPETGKHHRAESGAFITEPVLLPSRRVSVDTTSYRSYSPSNAAQVSHNHDGKDDAYGIVESSAFFIRDDSTEAEIVVFGDIEPDTISLEPRNEKVWEIAAPKITDGTLRAIFIECSYSDSVEDSSLYGHLCPRHLIAELRVLASKVLDSQKPRRGSVESRKRKRALSPLYPANVADNNPNEPLSPRSTASKRHSPSPKDRDPTNRQTKWTISGGDSGDERGSPIPERSPRRRPSCTSEEAGHISRKGRPLPLQDLQIYVIHVKDTLTDERSLRSQILSQLRTQAEEAGLGCEFYVPQSGDDVFI